MSNDDADYFYAGPHATIRDSNGRIVPSNKLVRNKIMRRIIRGVSYSQRDEHKIGYKLAVLREELAEIRALSENSHQYKRERARALKERRLERLVVREMRNAQERGSPITEEQARGLATAIIEQSQWPSNEKIFRPHRSRSGTPRVQSR